jgi:hypothetical protein
MFTVDKITNVPENPSNNVDDDGDRLIDETASDPIINKYDPNQSEIRSNGIDDDKDRIIDETCPAPSSSIKFHGPSSMLPVKPVTPIPILARLISSLMLHTWQHGIQTRVF